MRFTLVHISQICVGKCLNVLDILILLSYHYYKFVYKFLINICILIQPLEKLGDLSKHTLETSRQLKIT